MNMINFKEMKIFYTNAEQALVPVGDGIASASVAVDMTENDVLVCRVNAEMISGFDPDRALVLRPECDNGALELMACEAYSLYWCRPAFGKKLSDIPPKTAFAVIREGGTYTAILPLCDSVFKTMMQGNDAGFEFYMYSNCKGTREVKDQIAFICASGRDPDALLHKCMKAAAELLGNGLRMREERIMPEIFEYLGWCSWDAFPAVAVSHEGLVQKAHEFAEKKAPVRYAIIDDMWADCPHLNTIRTAAPGHRYEIMQQSKMRSFEGAPDRFPNGMRAAIADMKAAGIPHIGVWFPTTGYWSGISPNEEFYKEQKDDLTTTESGRITVKPDDKEAYSYFSSICARIRSWGADLVKIDNQGCHHLYRNVGAIGRTGRAMQNAIDSVCASEFNGALINCMGMPSECMFNRKSSAVCRCSGDFQPENREWFAKHVLQCSYNGLWQGQYYVNDWDMWWTDDAQATKNSLCRALSGGPIYVSDKVDRTKREILMPLIFEDGRILRCDKSATPSNDCLTSDPTSNGKPFKIRNVAGEAGLVAAFNIDRSNSTVSGHVSPADAGLPCGKYAYYEYFTGENGLVEAGEDISITLENNDAFRLYTFLPYDSEKPMLFGRLDKMVGVKAVTGRIGNEISIYEGGCFGFMSASPVKLYADGKEIELERSGMMNIAKLDADIENIRIEV